MTAKFRKLAFRWSALGLAAVLLALLATQGVRAQDAAIAIDYPENGTEPVATFTAVDPEGKSVSWSLLQRHQDDDGNEIRVDGQALTANDVADYDDFDLSTDGVLTFAIGENDDPPNFEAPMGAPDTGNVSDPLDNTYKVVVVASDAETGGKMDYHKVTVTVTNVDELGTLTLSNRQPVDGVRIMAMLTDVDGNISVQDWQWARGSSRSGPFTDIEETTSPDNGAKTDTYTPGPSDIGQYLRVTATYTDGEDSGKMKPVVSYARVVAARSSNAAPSIVNSNGEAIDMVTLRVAENSPAGTEVGGPIMVSNAENDVLTFKLSDTPSQTPAADKFVIDQNGQITVGEGTVLDTEDTAGGNNTFTVTVTVEDGNFTNGGPAAYSDMITVTINVDNVQEDPELTGKTSVEHAEGTAFNAAVASYTVTDDEDDAARTAVEVELSGPDAAAFTLTDDDTTVTSGTSYSIATGDGVWELAFEAEPDYESPADVGRDNTYNITITAKDSSDRTAVRNVVVMVTNVEEDGTVTYSVVTPRVGVAITATLDDDDGGESGLEWQWQTATADPSDRCTVAATNLVWGNAEGDGATTATYTPQDEDEDKCLRATVSYTDVAGDDDANNWLLNAVGDPAAPRFYDSADLDTRKAVDKFDIMFDENTAGESNAERAAQLHVIHRSDSLNVLTYQVNGPDMASFEIDRPVVSTVNLQAKGQLDYERQRTYMVTVTATDTDGNSASLDVTIKVQDVDEKPTIMVGEVEPTVSGLEKVYYAEMGTTSVATYRASGFDGTVAWTRSGDDAGDFSISNAGVLTFTSAPDYEMPADANTDNTYEVTVVATAGNDSKELDVIVVVTDADEEEMPPATTAATLGEWLEGNPSVPVSREEVIDAIRRHLHSLSASQ